MELNPSFADANLLQLASLATSTGLGAVQGTAASAYLRTENFLQSLRSNNAVSQSELNSLVSLLNQLFGSDSDPGIPALPANPGSGSGLKGEYFDNQDFTSLITTRVDPTVNFNWWTGAPTDMMTDDTFSVRWTGQVQPVYSENYTFYTRADDGVRLWVNGQELINDWTNHSVTESRGTIALEAGKKYDIKMEYFENRGVAVSRLLWSSPTQAKQIIPTSQLYSGSNPLPPPIDPTPLPALSVTSGAIAEGNTGTTNLGFTVSLSAASTLPVSVNYATANGTALDSFDYNGISGTLTFAAGETSKVLNVPILGDPTVEPDETFTLDLSNPANATIAIGQGTGTILNEDQPQPLPTLALNNVSLVEGNAGTTNAVFTVTLTGGTDSPVSVIYATADGTATAGSDYTATTGGLTFAPNDRTQTITVPIIGDTQFEPDETFFVRLTNPTAATISVGEGTGTIANDDSQILPLPDSISLAPVVTGLNSPTDVVNAVDGSGRLFITQQGGTIRIVRNGTLETTPFLDIRDRVKQNGGEQGLLSIAFPPNYATSGHFYVYYNNPDGNIVLSRFQRSTIDPNVADPASETILLTIPHPTFTNHNGGKLVFNPADGYLYIGIGDGGGGGDPSNNAQNPATLLGKILRIDVETPTTAPYVIPATNPFTATPDPSDLARDEIWAIGLRNPWRMSFDRKTNNLYIADVGQGDREEVNFQSVTSRGGENYGWKILEGTKPFSASSTVGLTAPLLEYDHSPQGGLSITGGYVYRGQTLPSLDGAYLYGDFVNGKIWGARRTSTGQLENKLLLDSTFGISTFGEDESGEIYVADYFSGGLYRVAL
jgi:glucose/arabinose dehydrogenase